ncbi:MAG TPA: FAD-dependent oxidoreductase, partial [Planctomycetota bacterium]|nr:FAD-dependent oxidoreductase [Planctomycetota bacterium]
MTDQASTGPWPATTELPRYAPLAHDVEADVCVVGAGIAGLTTAFLLAREGRRVVVLDDGPIGGGETGRTTAHLSPVLGTRYYELAQLHGEEGARTIASSHMAAVDFIEQTVAAERIACDFSRRDGWLFAPPDGPRDELERELEAVHRAGIPGVELHASAPLSTISRGPALRFPDQAQFHPLRYVSALARDLVARGGRIHCATRAAAFEVGPLATVATEAGPKVSAPWLVVATNSPVNDVVKMHTKLAPYRTYVVLLPVERDAVPRALFWDTADPYHYVRRLDVDSAEAGGHDLILVGGEDHKTGQADDADARYARLEEWGRARFPVRGPRVRAWSGQVLEPMDGIAFVGRNPGAHDHVLIATGDAGNGMTHGTIAGMLLADL